MRWKGMVINMLNNVGKVRNELMETSRLQTKILEDLRQSLQEAKQSRNERKIKLYTKRIQDTIKYLDKIKNLLACIRPNNEKDVEERTNIIKDYADFIDQVIPDDQPVVFHGNNNIGIVEKIIESGGLYTPSERGVEYSSFASQIDVTAKSNIQVSLDFADRGTNSYMPYGALFAFYPKEYEYKEVFKTGDNSEVLGGVESVSFSEDRFIGIITTDENIFRLRKAMERSNLDPNKIYTHEEFLEHSKNKYMKTTKK